MNHTKFLLKTTSKLRNSSYGWRYKLYWNYSSLISSCCSVFKPPVRTIKSWFKAGENEITERELDFTPNSLIFIYALSQKIAFLLLFIFKSTWVNVAQFKVFFFMSLKIMRYILSCFWINKWWSLLNSLSEKKLAFYQNVIFKKRRRRK